VSTKTVRRGYNFISTPDNENFREATMKRIGAAALLAAMLGMTGPMDAAAQAYPNKPVRFVVPFGAGGPVDIIARMLSDKLGALWNQNVLVEYRPGAGSVVGIDMVAKSPPDGYTVGVAITGLVINPSLRSSMPYDTVKDLAGITLVAVSHIAIVAKKDLPANNIAELVAYAKKNPGKLSYATGGAGTSLHLAGELLNTTAGIDMVHVPYRSSNAAYPDIFAGRIELQIDPLYASLPNIQAGNVKALAITSPQRAPSSPEIPTVGEDVATVLKAPDMVERMKGVGMDPTTMKPADFDAFIKSEIERWAPIVKASGAKAD
jgi:tripartite-type tricarboxylate transporter receptor subunit TctC